VGALPFGREQDDDAGAQPLPRHRQTPGSQHPLRASGTCTLGIKECFFFDETRRSVGLAYNDERGHGLVHPAVLLEEVAEDDAGAEQRHEEVDVDDGGVVGGRAEHAQARQVRHQAGAHGLAVAVAAERSRRRRRRDPPRKKKDANFVLPELVLLLGIELGRNKIEAFFFSSSG
jgi:hypothetical protein